MTQGFEKYGITKEEGVLTIESVVNTKINN